MDTGKLKYSIIRGLRMAYLAGIPIIAVWVADSANWISVGMDQAWAPIAVVAATMVLAFLDKLLRWKPEA